MQLHIEKMFITCNVVFWLEPSVSETMTSSVCCILSAEIS